MESFWFLSITYLRGHQFSRESVDLAQNVLKSWTNCTRSVTERTTI